MVESLLVTAMRHNHDTKLYLSRYLNVPDKKSGYRQLLFFACLDFFMQGDEFLEGVFHILL